MLNEARKEHLCREFGLDPIAVHIVAPRGSLMGAEWAILDSLSRIEAKLEVLERKIEDLDPDPKLRDS